MCLSRLAVESAGRKRLAQLKSKSTRFRPRNRFLFVLFVYFRGYFLDLVKYSFALSAEIVSMQAAKSKEEQIVVRGVPVMMRVFL